MSDEMDGLDMALMQRYPSRAANTVTGRRMGETKMIHHADGRALRATGRTAQMNLKVRPEFRARVAALAAHHDVMMVQIIEEAVEAYEKTGTRGR